MDRSRLCRKGKEHRAQPQPPRERAAQVWGAVLDNSLRIRGEARKGNCAGDFTDMVRGKNQIKSMELEILSCQLLKGECGGVQIVQDVPEGSQN